MTDKISLAGDLGSGKSTVSNILIEKLSAEYYSTGAIVRKIAERHNMSVVELNVYIETHPEIDTEIDNGLMELSGLDKCLIIDSRMAWHFTKGTFKVYLSVDAETSAIRIMGANRVGEHSATLEETIRDTKARRESEKKRYKEQYGVDIKDLSNYSLIVDTSVATPTQVAECILDSFEKWQKDRDFSKVYISFQRLNFPDDEPDAELIAHYSSMLELGESLPEISVIECDGEFYIDNGAEIAIAYSFGEDVFIPASLVKGDISGKKYVRMKDSL